MGLKLGNLTLIILISPEFDEIHIIMNNGPSWSIRFTSVFLAQDEKKATLFLSNTKDMRKDRTAKLFNKLKHLLQPILAFVFFLLKKKKKKKKKSAKIRRQTR